VGILFGIRIISVLTLDTAYTHFLPAICADFGDIFAETRCPLVFLRYFGGTFPQQRLTKTHPKHIFALQWRQL
jgi:hypothetical protein